MSSRQEQKEARRREREAAESAFAAKDRRKRTLGAVVGVLLGLAAITAIVVVVFAGGGSDKKTKPIPKGSVAIPRQATTNEAAAIKTAGCTLKTFTPSANDRTHVTSKVTYKQNPPVFGPHNPVWASDGDYAGQGSPPTEKQIHTLEHGRVDIQYGVGTPPRRVKQLETLLGETFGGKPAGYKQLLFENTTKMPFAVAATAWGVQLGCPTFTDKTFDALRTFRAAHVEKGPENIPYPE